MKGKIMSDKKAIDLEGLKTFKEKLDPAINKSINKIEFFYGSGQGLKVTDNAGTVTTVGIPVVGSSVNGFMSKDDKTKLDSLESVAAMTDDEVTAMINRIKTEVG